MYEKIKQLCKKKGITISQLESELEFAKSSLHKIDKHKPNLKKLQKIADFFNISVDYLLTGKEATEKGLSIDTALLLADLQFNEQFLEIAKMYKELSAERQQDIYDYVQMLYAKK